MIISFVSIKGGVGKTTLALETASSLANHYGKKVLLVDANFSAPNVALNLGIKPENTLHDLLSGKIKNLSNITYESYGFDFVPASLDYKDQVYFLKLRDALEKVKDKYDFIILDSSPNPQELLSVIAASEKVFVVTTPDLPTMFTSARAAQIALMRKTPVVGIVINKIRNPSYEYSLEEVEKHFGIPVVALVNDDKDVIESSFYFKPHTIHKENSYASKEIKRFAGSLAGNPEKIGWFMKNFGKMGKEKVNRELMRKGLYNL